MNGLDLNTWSGFWETFRLPIAMSLIGAVIGHYRKNGVIQMPIVSISYSRGPHFADLKGFFRTFRVLYLIVDFIVYIFGLRWDSNRPRDAVWVDLGFLGDMLVGVGTGIIAKAGMTVTNTNNTYSVVSASLLAGFAGLSYVQWMQTSGMREGAKEREAKFELATQDDIRGKEEIEKGITQAAGTDVQECLKQ